MANNSFKIKNSLNVEPKTGSTVTTKGDVAYNSSSDQLEVFTTVAEKVATDSNTLTMSNKTLTTPVISTITNTGTLTLPTSTDTLVGRATTDTLTNKTLTAPIISTISNTGTITLPTSTDTLVGRDTTDTLTNKTISGASNTISNVSLTSSVTGTLPIANGGTSATTKAGAFDALSPMTTAGDLVYGGTAGTGTRLPGGADNQVLKYVSGVPTWSTFSNNGINYISSNPDAETGVSGWSTYLDAAGVSPIDGTGGVSTLTFARTTSSPLRGTGSFLITQPNATSVQGNGVSFDFTIDSADKAKPLVVSFDYNASTDFTASSGQTGSESDIEVYLYDVTNSSLIAVSPKVLTSKGANNFEFKGEFQTASNSSSYRLILHCATTNAPATGFQLKFDNVFVGPQANVQGAPVTDWESYTPTFTGLGTVTNIECEFRRVGDSCEIRGKFLTGTCTATEARLSLPNSITSADVVKIPSIKLCGQLAKGSAADSYNGIAVLIKPSVTYLNFGGNYSGGTASGQSTIVEQQGSTIFADNETDTFFASVPIAGWSSNVQMSQDTDTRVVAAKYYQAAGQAIPDSTSTTILYDTKVYDTHSAFNTTTGEYTSPVSGFYRINARDAFAANGTGYRQFSLLTNGAGAEIIWQQMPNAANGFITGGETTVYLTAGDKIVLQGYQTSGGSLSLTGSGYDYFMIERISGPATIAASETVAFKAMSASATCVSTTSGTDTLIFPSLGTFGFDTHSGYNSTTGVYTIPISGIYRVTGSVQVSQAAAADYNVGINLQKNSTTFATGSQRFETTNTTYKNALSTASIKCVAGDLIRIVPSTNAAGTIGSNDLTNYFEVEKIGN